MAGLTLYGFMLYVTFGDRSLQDMVEDMGVEPTTS